MVRVRTTPKPDVQPDSTSRLNPGAFFDNKEISLNSGETKEIPLRFAAFNPDAFRGNESACVTILARDGRPAAGEKATIGYFDGHYGLLPVFDGVVPDSGVIELNGITGRRGAKESPFGSYFVKVNDRHLGDFDLPEKGVPRLEFRIPLRAGDTVPDVPLVDIATGETVRLEDLRGKIVLLEFWATWCGPCRPALERLNALALERRDDWKDRVALVAVSIDDSIAIADAHVKQRGWTAVQHLWSGGESTGIESPAARAFVIDRVPEAFLVEPGGKVVWRGHSLAQERMVLSSIERLLSER